MPGPDGIPASAFKARGPMAIDVIFDVYEALSTESAYDSLVEAFHGMSQEGGSSCI